MRAYEAEPLEWLWIKVMEKFNLVFRPDAVGISKLWLQCRDSGRISSG